MNAKAEDIKQATQNLKETVKKVYQLSKEIDSLPYNNNSKELIAKFNRERSLLRFQAQQQANAIEFEKKKIELMSKDFKTKTREIEAQNTERKRPSFAPPLSRLGMGAFNVEEGKWVRRKEDMVEEDEPADEEERQYYKRQAFRTAYAAIVKKIQKLRTEIDEKIVREEMSLNSEYEKLQRMLNEQKDQLGVYSEEFFKNGVLPKEVKFDMALAYRDCFERFMDNQKEEFDNIETIEGLKDFETLIMKEFENCRQLYEGRVSQIILERKEMLQIAERKEKQIPGALAEAIRNMSHIRQLPNFIQENEIDLNEAEIDSRRYRAARKASPQLARERRQPPSFYGDIRRGFGYYGGLEDDYEYPHV